MLLYLALKNIITKKSSYVIVLFIAFAVMMLVVTNAVFDSTEKGVQETFVSSFTGDIVIRPKNVPPLSLFGDETPVTGELSNIPILNPYGQICDVLSSEEKISGFTPQITGQVAISNDSGDDLSASYIFGVNGSDYVNLMSSIKIIEGGPWKPGEKGAMLTKNHADELKVKIGDEIRLAVQNGLASRLRAVPVTAIYEYKNDNSTLENLVLVNSETVRSILDISDMADSSQISLDDEQEEILGGSDLDDLFSDASDTSETIQSDEITFTDEEKAELASSYSSATWNFIICRLQDSKDAYLEIKNLNRIFRENEWQVEAVNWRSSAGNTAFYLYILRLILNIGIIIVLAAGFIVVNNTLVINVLDRIREIGTMRAIGANKRYISKECMAETLLMALAAGIFGCILGTAASGIVNAMKITIHNSFLIQLFGGTEIVTSVKFSNLFGSFLVSIVIGLIAWIYPVINALRVNPVQAMQGAK